MTPHTTLNGCGARQTTRSTGVAVIPGSPDCGFRRFPTPGFEDPRIQAEIPPEGINARKAAGDCAEDMIISSCGIYDVD